VPMVMSLARWVRTSGVPSVEDCIFLIRMF
jgi:hypothetical protein